MPSPGARAQWQGTRQGSGTLSLALGTLQGTKAKPAKEAGAGGRASTAFCQISFRTAYMHEADRWGQWGGLRTSDYHELHAETPLTPLPSFIFSAARAESFHQDQYPDPPSPSFFLPAATISPFLKER